MKLYPFEYIERVNLTNLSLKIFLNPIIFIEKISSIIKDSKLDVNLNELNIFVDCQLDQLVLNYIVKTFSDKKNTSLIYLNKYLTRKLKLMHSNFIMNISNMIKDCKSLICLRYIFLIFKNFQKIRGIIDSMSFLLSENLFNLSELTNLIAYEYDKIKSNISTFFKQDCTLVRFKSIKNFLFYEIEKTKRLIDVFSLKKEINSNKKSKMS